MNCRWNEDMSLEEIRRIVIHIVNEDLESEKYPGDLVKLSEAEYRILCNKLANFINLSNLEHYCICILLAWLNSFYRKREIEFLEAVKAETQAIPQHYTLNVYQNFWDTFHNFGISTKGHDCKTVDDIHELLRSYAG